MKNLFPLTLFLTLSALIASAPAADPKRPTVLFLVGEAEYSTAESLTAFAESELQPRGLNVRFIHAASNERASPDCHRFPGLQEALREADLLFLSTRRRFPVAADMAAIRRWFAEGKPMVGIRTASHPFGAREKGAGYQPPPGHEAWQDFDREILGASYTGHYGSKDGHETLAAVVPTAKGAGILHGVHLPARAPVPSHLYKCEMTDPRASVLLEATIAAEKAREPVAWTRQREGQRIFYTSLGSKEDMQLPWLNQLLVNAVFWALKQEIPRKQAVVEGHWILSVTDPEGTTHHPALTLKREAGGWSGVYRAASDQRDYPAKDVSWRDDTLKFTAQGGSWTVRYSGRVENHSLRGQMEYDLGGNTGQIEFTGRRDASR